MEIASADISHGHLMKTCGKYAEQHSIELLTKQAMKIVFITLFLVALDDFVTLQSGFVQQTLSHKSRMTNINFAPFT